MPIEDIEHFRRQLKARLFPQLERFANADVFRPGAEATNLRVAACAGAKRKRRRGGEGRLVQIGILCRERVGEIEIREVESHIPQFSGRNVRAIGGSVPSA